MNEEMSLEEQAKKIEEIYNEAILKLQKLGHLRNIEISNYIKKLENQKIDAIRTSILSNNK